MRGLAARTTVVAKGGPGTGAACNFQHAKAHMLGRVRRRSLDAMPRPSGPGLPARPARFWIPGTAVARPGTPQMADVTSREGPGPQESVQNGLATG